MGSEGGDNVRKATNDGQVNPAHFALDTSFCETERADFEMHVTSLSSVYPQDFEPTARQVAAVEYEGLRIVCSHRLTFVLLDVVHAILEFTPDGVAAPITEVACWSYGLLMR